MNRHHELRAMAIAFAVEVWPHEPLECIAAAKKLQSALDAECEAAGHTWEESECVSTTQNVLDYQDTRRTCQDCGVVEKSE